MEYLASGVPTVAYRLDGMPEDYEGLFIDATDGGLKAALNRALAMDPEELHQLSLRAKTYVIDHKGSKDNAHALLSYSERSLRTLSDDKTFDIPVAVFISNVSILLRGFSIDLLRFGLVSSISLLTRER